MILVTGASGLIGSFIVRKLLSENLPVRVLVRPHSDRSMLAEVEHQIDWAEGDILDIGSLESAMNGVETVIHAAAIVSFGEVGKDRMFEVNVEGTRNVINTALLTKIKKLVYLSSVAAIGRDEKRPLIDENNTWTESPLNSFYAKTKYLAELEVWRGYAEGLPVAMLNPSVVLGPGDWNRSSTKIFKNLYEGMAFYPTGSVNVVDVRDVADAAFLLLTSNTTGQRFIINGHHLLYHDLFAKVSNGFGKKEPRFKLSKNIALAGYYLLKILAPFYLSKRYITRETITITSSHFEYSNRKFVDQFHFQYRDLDDTVRWSCAQLIKKIKA